jgi:N-acetylglucosamine malate deacetylase 1
VTTNQPAHANGPDADVLVAAPHPDDEVLGCGGSIANHVTAGRRVVIAYLTSGERGSRTVAAACLGPRREQEAVAAAAALGVPSDRLVFLRLPDGDLQPGDLTQLGTVVNLLRTIRPTVLYVPHPGEASFDHRAAHALCWRAAGIAGSGSFPEWGDPHWVPTVLGYEVWSPIGEPAYLEDVNSTVERKLTALSCYASQSQAAKGERQASHVGPDGLYLSGFRGASTIGGHREAFTVLRLGSVFR